MTDEVGTIPAFPDIEPTPTDRRRWECTQCGGTLVTVDHSKPSIDPRYALGYCEKCTPMRKAKAKGQEVAHRATAILREVK